MLEGRDLDERAALHEGIAQGGARDALEAAGKEPILPPIATLRS